MEQYEKIDDRNYKEIETPAPIETAYNVDADYAEIKELEMHIQGVQERIDKIKARHAKVEVIGVDVEEKTEAESIDTSAQDGTLPDEQAEL